jgi:ribosomal protein L24E
MTLASVTHVDFTREPRISHLLTNTDHNSCKFCGKMRYGSGIVQVEAQDGETFICFTCARKIRNIVCWLDQKNRRARIRRRIFKTQKPTNDVVV